MRIHLSVKGQCAGSHSEGTSLLQKFQDDTADVAGSAQSGLTTAAYTVLTAGFFAAGASYLYAPAATLQVTLRGHILPGSIFLQCFCVLARLVLQIKSCPDTLLPGQGRILHVLA